MKTRTEGQQAHRDDIRDRVAEWLERQPSFYYDLDDIQLSQEEPPRWARVHGTEDLATDENVMAGNVPHVIHFGVHRVDGTITSSRQPRLGARTAESIRRGQQLLDAHPALRGASEFGAAQDAITDVLEAVDYYGGDAKDVILAAIAAWDHDREGS